MPIAIPPEVSPSLLSPLQVSGPLFEHEDMATQTDGILSVLDGPFLNAHRYVPLTLGFFLGGADQAPLLLKMNI